MLQMFPLSFSFLKNVRSLHFSNLVCSDEAVESLFSIVFRVFELGSRLNRSGLYKKYTAE